MQSLDDIIVRFDIKPSHTLKQQNHEQSARAQTNYETCWYIEKDEQKQIVARYRSWSNQATQPPYRAQLGWERYSPTGTLLEREVSYSEPDTTEYLH